MKRRSAAGASALAVAAATATGVLASTGSSPESHQARAAASAPSGLAASFAVLDKTGAVANGPNTFESASGRLMHIDPARARPVEVPGHNVWAATNAEGDLCLTFAASSQLVVGGCAHPAAADSDGLFTQSHPSPADIKAEELPPATTDVAALVPNGVATVDFEFGDGSAKTLSVHDNGVVARFDAQPSSARYTDAAGDAHSIDLGA